MFEIGAIVRCKNIPQNETIEEYKKCIGKIGVIKGRTNVNLFDNGFKVKYLYYILFEGETTSNSLFDYRLEEYSCIKTKKIGTQI